MNAPVISDTLPENAGVIVSNLNSSHPRGSTPLYDGMAKFTETDYASAFADMGFNSYLIVVSDGGDSCGKNNNVLDPVEPADMAEITTVLLTDNQIKSIAIGFGDQVSPEQLDAIAANGGTDYTEYIVVDDQATLEAAMEEIVGNLVSCVYELEITEPDVDPTKVNYYFVTLDTNGNEVEEVIPFDEDCTAGKGWRWIDFDNFVVEFCEEACAKLQTGDVKKILAEFGCETIIIEKI